MEKYDVLIAGAATSGAYFARKLAERGFKVKVIEKLPREKVGTRLDIFHIARPDIARFGLPGAEEDDPAMAFSFTENGFSSPSDLYRVKTKADIVGFHMREYVAEMISAAEAAGAEFEFGAAFREFIFEYGSIAGVRYETADGLKEARVRTVADCSGMSAEVRRALPNGYGVENFKVQDDEALFVLLRYGRFAREEMNRFFLHAKSWFAPMDTDGRNKILGTGEVGSYERAETVAARLDKTVAPEGFELLKVEKGVTPYRRPPYSLVADNFIVSGDAACLTKPDCGEGVTSSMVMLDIAADVLTQALHVGNTGKKALWPINREYNRVQGADFAMVRAFMTKLINAITDDELEYCFKNGIVFNEKFLGGASFGVGDIGSTIKEICSALSVRGISGRTVSEAMKGAALGFALKQHYLAFPSDPAKYDLWTKAADALWNRVGKVK